MADVTNPLTDTGISGAQQTASSSNLDFSSVFANVGKAINSYTDATNEANKAQVQDDAKVLVDEYALGETGDAQGELPSAGLSKTIASISKTAKAAGTLTGIKAQAARTQLAKRVRDARGNYTRAVDRVEFDTAMKGILGYDPSADLIKNRREVAQVQAQTIQEFYQTDYAKLNNWHTLPVSEQEANYSKFKLQAQAEEHRLAVYADRKMRGELTAGDAIQFAEAQSANITTSIITSPQFEAFRTSGKVPDNLDEVKLMAQAIAKGRQKLEQEWLSVKGGLSKFGDPKKAQEAFDRSVKVLDDISKALDMEDFRGAGAAAAANKWLTDQSVQRLLAGSDAAVDAVAFVKVFGEAEGYRALDEVYQKSGLGGLAQTLSIQLHKEQKNMNLGKIVELLVEKNENEPTAEASKAIVQAVTTTAQMAGTADEGGTSQLLKNVYNPDSMKRLMSTLSSGSMDALAMLSRKAVTENILKKAGQDGLTQYTEAILHGFTSTPAFQNSVKLAADSGKKIYIDEEGLLFVKTVGEQQSGNLRLGRRNVNEGSALNEQLAGYNKVLGNLNYATRKQGGKSVKRLVSETMKTYGVEVNEDPNDAENRIVDIDPDNIRYKEEVLSPIQETISEVVGFAEGTGNDFDVLLGYSQDKEGSPVFGKKVSEMTIDEALDFSRPGGEYAQYSKKLMPSLAAQGKYATPMGPYQIVGNTLKQVAKEMKLDGSTKFSPEVQKAMFAHLLKKAGYDEYIAGDMTSVELVRNMGQTWDGLKNGRNATAANKKLIEALSRFEQQQGALDPRNVSEGDTARL